MKFKVALMSMAACLAAAPSLAVVAPFGGPAVGVDPLGHTWVAAGDHWGEPGYLNGTLTFNPSSVSNGAGTYATSFSFTFLKGVAGVIDQTPSTTYTGSGPETRFSNLTDGAAWLVSFSGNQVTFTAPTMASKLDIGDQFFVNVAFTGPITVSKFSFAGLWDDADVGVVPEPASWAMMLGGFGLLGGVMRSQRRSKQLANA